MYCGEQPRNEGVRERYIRDDENEQQANNRCTCRKTEKVKIERMKNVMGEKLESNCHDHVNRVHRLFRISTTSPKTANLQYWLTAKLLEGVSAFSSCGTKFYRKILNKSSSLSIHSWWEVDCAMGIQRSWIAEVELCSSSVIFVL